MALKNYKKLVTLGCSLSPRGFWPYTVRNSLNVEEKNHIHFGFGGGSNYLTLHRWYEYMMVAEDLKDTLVIWQITGIHRDATIFDDYPKEYLLSEREVDNGMYGDGKCTNDNDGDWFQYHTFFGNTKRIGKWGKNTYKDLPHAMDPNILCAQLVSTIATVPCDKAVFRGWSGALPETYWKESKKVFHKNNAIVIEECIADWCIQNDLKMQPDGVHPTETSSQTFGNFIFDTYFT